MKQYFAKYLLVEGKIQIGDIYLMDTSAFSDRETGEPVKESYWITKVTALKERGFEKQHINGKPAGYTPYEWNNKKTKASKLFLCSRDIQVGDKVQRYFKDKLCVPTKVLEIQGDKVKMDGGSFSPIWDDKKLFFKVIGEISPDALGYVKEGDEFNEDQVEEWQMRPDMNNQFYLPVGISSIRGLPTVWKIKGPCGHFH